MAEDEDSKTEEPTSKRRQDVRTRGDVAQSQELNSAFVLLTGVITLKFLGPWMYGVMKDMLMWMLMNIASWNMETISSIQVHMTETAVWTIVLMFPFILIVMLFGILISRIQVGGLWATDKIKPKWSNIKIRWSELNILKFDKLSKLGIDFLKLLVIAPVAYYTVKARIPEFVPLIDKTLEDIWAFIFDLAFDILFRIGILLLIIGIIDYIKTRFQYEKKIKMTKWEVKQERKDLFGDPKVRGWQHSQRKQLFKNFMMQQLPEADVVITNPIHYAIALKYDTEKMSAPRVIAKGQRLAAQRIKDIARLNDVPMVENKPLARALFKAVDVGDEVPEDLYQAVAEVLAYVYRIRPDRVKVPA